ncbi:hypothetical protein SAMCCGM7_Ch2393 [Sinorhizobium americanum CCGM7]|nr:hypothetical protein SAMCCGM7_Ch2393 [Sinorhizobium americanum CCGM7]
MGGVAALPSNNSSGVPAVEALSLGRAVTPAKPPLVGRGWGGVKPQIPKPSQTRVRPPSR